MAHNGGGKKGDRKFGRSKRGERRVHTPAMTLANKARRVRRSSGEDAYLTYCVDNGLRPGRAVVA